MATKADMEFRAFSLSESREKKIFLFLICAIAISIPFAIILNSILSIALLLFWILFMRKTFERSRIKVLLLISALFWIALIGMAYTQNLEEGLFRLQQKSLLLLFSLVFGTVTFELKQGRKWILTFFLAAVILACCICLIDALRYWLQYGNYDRFFSHGLVQFMDIYPYVLAILCLSSVLILSEAIGGKIELHPWLHKGWVAVTIILFLSVFIFLLSVKQIIIAWIFFALVYSVKANTNKKQAFILLFCFFLVTISVVLMPTLKAKVVEVIAGKENDIPLDQDASLGRGWNGIAMRKAVWTCSLDAIEKNVWLGAGTGDGQDELQAAYEKRQFYFASRYNRFNTHNQFLQTLVNFGIIGLVIWLISLILLFQNLRSNMLSIYLLAILVFAMLTESMLETNKGIVTMAFLLTLFSPGLTETNLGKKPN